MAEATEEKKKQLRDAFGIRDDYVEGSAFDPIHQVARAEQAKAEKEGKNEYVLALIIIFTV